MTRRVRVAFKRWAARHWLIIEFCHYCGVRQPIVWTAGDALWTDVCGSGGGVLCPSCFTARCGRLGIPLRWIPTPEEPKP